MILDKVRIKNFRQYRDVEIDFAKNPEKNFTIIQGDNGTGKTTLLNALSWCLYGEEIHNYGDKTALGYCNNKTAFLADEDEEIIVQVEIEFKNKDEILIFSRGKKYQKRANKVEEALISSNLEVFRQAEDDIRIEEHDAFLRDQLIPEEIAEYFFFDGAILQKYFQNNSTAKIKKSILEISQLNLIKNMESNIGKLIDRYNKDLKNIAPKLGNIRSNLTDYNKKIDAHKNDLEKTKKNIEDAEEKFKEINSKLLEMDSTKINELVKEEKDLKKDIDSLLSKIEKKEIERKKFIIQTYPVLFSYNYFKKFLEISEESREKGHIPPLYRKKFIKDLIENEKCICGNDLNLNSDSKKQLEKVLNNTSDITDNFEGITKAVINVEMLMNKIKEFKPKLIEIKKTIKELHEKHDKKAERKREISSIIKKDKVESIRVLQETKESLDDTIKNNIKRVGSLETEIKNLNQKKKKFEQEKNEIDRLDKTANYINKKILKSEEIQKVVRKLNTTFSKKILKKMEKLTKENFLEIIWKDDEYNDLEINEDYQIFIRNKIGQLERPGDLSDGEKLIVGLCFMLALHRITGFNLPIIMDTPLGILGSKNKLNLANSFPKLSGSKQIVLLVTDTEYSKDFRKLLSNHVGREYIIEWSNSDEGKESKVILSGQN
jgi:DNA sulfur modification protein DndD